MVRGLVGELVGVPGKVAPSVLNDPPSGRNRSHHLPVPTGHPSSRGRPRGPTETPDRRRPRGTHPPPVTRTRHPRHGSGPPERRVGPGSVPSVRSPDGTFRHRHLDSPISGRLPTRLPRRHPRLGVQPPDPALSSRDPDVTLTVASSGPLPPLDAGQSVRHPTPSSTHPAPGMSE